MTELEQIQSLQAQLEMRQLFRMELANLLQLSEDEFQRLILEIEKSPLFIRLYQKEGIIRRQRFPRTDISSHFLELKEELVADKGSLDVESLLQSRDDILRHIRKIGPEKFKRYFLYPELGLSKEEIARDCDLALGDVEMINSLVDELSIMSEFYHPSALSTPGLHYSKVASLERGPEGFIIGYFSPSLAQGRYHIDYERWQELNRGGTFSPSEAREINKLLRKLELINSRKDTVYHILEQIVEKQALYLESGDVRALLPFTQKELAHRIGVAPSSVSRAIRGRSVDTPWEEMPLKDFFPRPKRFRKELVKQILAQESLPDKAVRAKLEEMGVSLSRRSVASLRRELKIPPSWRRS